MATLAAYRNLHAGASIVVCGCGTSLSTLTDPKRFLTIGVNDVGRMFDPDYLVVVNHRREFRDDRFRYVEQSRARALFTQLDLRVAHANVVRFRLGQRGGTDFTDPNVLNYARNSPYVATCLAVHLGAKRIGLIGVDFTEHHFFGKTGIHPLHRELPQIDSEYRRLREALLALGVELVNLSGESRLTSLPKMTIEEFAEAERRDRKLRIVSYATTPVAGVPAILARCINERTPHEARCVWETDHYGNGVAFRGDVEWSRSSAEAARLIDEADAIIVHNGKVAPRHRTLVDAKPAITLAHNYAWNVDQRFVKKGLPGLVVGQYQATLPELAGWTGVPNPVLLSECEPLPKDDVVTIAYTPSGKHERYPPSHRLYWHSKGYETTMRVLETLARRYPLRIEAIRDRQVTHAESLAMKQRAHIVIDECVTGSYHRNSLEGLAYGCVVVNGIGILPEVERVFRNCAPESETIPFVPATLETLEQVLRELIELGPAELASRGAENRAWMDRHWDFAAQWKRVWQPAVDDARRTRAIPAARPAAVTLPAPEPAPSEPAPSDPLADVTVVIPCGGEERLRNLRAVVAALREANMQHVILAESDSEPRALPIATQAGYRHLFVPRDGVYHKARVMNEGARAVTTSRFLWLDADLLVTRRFLEQAVAEAMSLDLDCLVPWTSVRYLSESDSAAVAERAKTPEQCTPVNTYLTRQGCRGGIVVMKTEFFRQFGGVCEEFRGWGGEDNAFFHKASVLGRAAATQRADQHAWHLWHPLSGGYGPPAAMAANPHYAKNLALTKEIRALRTREQFLARFPPQSQPLSAPQQGSHDADAERGGLPFDVVIPSASGRNLIACVKALYEREPQLDPSRIIIVDDGARAEAEAELSGVRWIDGVRPFVYARNANLGLAASKRDVILLGDDTILETPGGLRRLAETAHSRADAGLVAAGVRGVVGNANQRARRGTGVRLEARQLCFVAVYLRRDVLDQVGPLDERFVGYGFEDDDYSQRVREAGRVLLVDDGCVVEHGTLPSTFRSRPDHQARMAQNRKLFAEKVAVRHKDDRAPRTAVPDDVLCVLRVKNEAAHIREVLARALPLCGRAVVFDDHSDDDTPAICRSFGDRVRVIPSMFSGIDEARDKNFLLGIIREMSPAWVLWIDGDEILERAGADRLRQILDHAPAGTAVYTLRVSYLWDAEDRVRVDGIWGRFRRPSLFRWRGQRVETLAFPEKKAPNLHCGNVPRGIAGHTRHAEVRLKHYGYIDPHERQKKYQWYTTIDPGNVVEDFYRHLADIPGARHAPGPPVFVPWTE